MESSEEKFKQPRDYSEEMDVEDFVRAGMSQEEAEEEVARRAKHAEKSGNKGLTDEEERRKVMEMRKASDMNL